MNYQYIKNYLHKLSHRDLVYISNYFGINPASNKNTLVSNLLNGGAAEANKPVVSTLFPKDQSSRLVKIIQDLEKLKEDSKRKELDLPIIQLKRLIHGTQRPPQLERQNTEDFDSFLQYTNVVDDKGYRTQKTLFRANDNLFNTNVLIELVGNSDVLEKQYGAMQCLQIEIRSLHIRDKKQELFDSLLSLHSFDFYTDNFIYLPQAMSENHFYTCQYEITTITRTGKFLISRLGHHLSNRILPNKVLWRILDSIFNACFTLHTLGYYIHSLTLDSIIKATFPGGIVKYFVSDYSNEKGRPYNQILGEFFNIIITHIIEFNSDNVVTYITGTDREKLKDQSKEILSALQEIVKYVTTHEDPDDIHQYFNIHIRQLYTL